MYFWRATTIAIVLALPGFSSLFFSSFTLEFEKEVRIRSVVYWAIVLGGWIALLNRGRPTQSLKPWPIVTLMIADVLLIGLRLPDSKKTKDVYPTSPAIDFLRKHNPDGQRAYDPEPATRWEGSMLILPPYECLLGPGSPQSSVYGIPSIRGYNPLDVARYRQYLAFIAGDETTDRAFGSRYSHPVVSSLSSVEPVKNRQLLDLLSVRYLVAKSNDSRTGAGWQQVAYVPLAVYYNFLGEGIDLTNAQTVYENQTVMPRTFVLGDVVPQAADRNEVQSQLQSLDIRLTATLEDWNPARDPLPRSTNPPGPARLRSHKPNEIIIDLDGKTAGLLVLTDPWYPGWLCRIDGNEVPIWKANYAFRGVMVPEDSREVVFHFKPRSYRWGKWISLGTLTIVLLLGIPYLMRRVRQKLSPSA